MPQLTVDGAVLNYQITGSGSPLVLVHGSATDLSTWDGVIDDLAAHHRVITYDRRGYGRSQHSPVRDHRIHARDLEAVLEQLAIIPATVVGWSSGGNVTLAVAASRPELFRNIVVVEPPFHGLRHSNRAVLATALKLKLRQLQGRPVEALEVFLRFGSTLRSGGNGYDLAGEAEREKLRAYPGPVLAEWDPHPFGVMHEHVSTAAVAAIATPLTWLLGEQSLPWMATLHARVARRNSTMRTVVVPGAGHLVHLDRPADFVREVIAAMSLPGSG
jgi:pimeloyl-ACP methyl ester carboxylesterase